MDRPECLPSGVAAYELVQGNRGALPEVASSVVSRAGLIAIGMLLVGGRKNVVRNSIAGALAVEIWILGRMWNAQR